MHWRGSLQAASVVSRLDLSGVSRVLDVGGGSGAYAMAFVQAREGIEAVVFDLPGVIPHTEAYIEEVGLSDKVKTSTGDYLEDDLGGGFDLVFLSAVIHSNSAEENQSLLRKVAGALEPNGQIVISDFIMDEDRTSPAIGTLFSLNMLVATESGDTYTESEVGGWLERAAFYGIKRIGTDFGTSLMVARKAPAS
jgi:2-polyprenyl-3-methyl-5-hydroxy-6-metoxy-1,4-benzoquinol methylase